MLHKAVLFYTIMPMPPVWAHKSTALTPFLTLWLKSMSFLFRSNLELSEGIAVSKGWAKEYNTRRVDKIQNSMPQSDYQPNLFQSTHCLETIMLHSSNPGTGCKYLADFSHLPLLYLPPTGYLHSLVT